jgi:hypothetical protein
MWPSRDIAGVYWAASAKICPALASSIAAWLQAAASKLGAGPANFGLIGRAIGPCCINRAGPSRQWLLADARVAALAARQKAAAGTDPVMQRKDARAARKPAEVITFKAAAVATIEAKRAGWSNAKHAAQWTATLEQYAFPKLGNKPVGCSGWQNEGTRTASCSSVGRCPLHAGRSPARALRR